MIAHPEARLPGYAEPEETRRWIELAQLLDVVENLTNNSIFMHDEPQFLDLGSAGLINFRSHTTADVLELLCLNILGFQEELDRIMKDRQLLARLEWAEVKMIAETVCSIASAHAWGDGEGEDGLTDAEREAYQVAKAFWAERSLASLEETPATA